MSMIKTYIPVRANPMTDNDHLTILKLFENMITKCPMIVATNDSMMTILVNLVLLRIMLNNITYAKYMLLFIMYKVSNFSFLFLQMSWWTNESEYLLAE